MLALLSMKSLTGAVPLTLVCHPQSFARAIRAIDVVLAAGESGSLKLSFALQGELTDLRIPETRLSRRGHKLWQHTCFEVFIMSEEGPGYREFNFSPSSEWAAFTFRDYRDGGVLEVELPPGIEVRRSGHRLELDAEIPRDYLPPGRALQLGLSAVVEDADGVLSYWALRHPPGKPDFHHTDAFALQRALP